MNVKMDKAKLINSLGLVQRAGKLITGEQFVLKSVKSEKAKIVFLASDAGYNTTKRIKDKTDFYNVLLIDTLTTEEINKAIGKKNRKALAIEDKNFAKMIEGQIY